MTQTGTEELRNPARVVVTVVRVTIGMAWSESAYEEQQTSLTPLLLVRPVMGRSPIQTATYFTFSLNNTNEKNADGTQQLTAAKIRQNASTEKCRYFWQYLTSQTNNRYFEQWLTEMEPIT